MKLGMLYFDTTTILVTSVFLLCVPDCLGQDYPFMNPSLPWDTRVKDLINRLSLDEMVLQVIYFVYYTLYTLALMLTSLLLVVGTGYKLALASRIGKILRIAHC